MPERNGLPGGLLLPGDGLLCPLLSIPQDPDLLVWQLRPLQDRRYAGAPERRRGQHPECTAVHDLAPAIRAIYAADYLRADHYQHTLNDLGADIGDRHRAGCDGALDPPGFQGI